MKKIAIALILLNMLSICSASTFRSSARYLYKNNAQNAAQSLKKAQKIKNSQNHKMNNYTNANTNNTPFIYNTNPVGTTKSGVTKNSSGIFNSLASIDKNYFNGAIAGFVAFFGYKALANNENEPTDTSMPIINTNKTEKLVSSIEENNAPVENQQVSNFSDFAMKHAYENPKNAIFNIYNNPNGENALKALHDPMISGTIATTALGGYAYYQYLQYLEKQAKAQKEKDDQLKAKTESENQDSIEDEDSIS